MKSSGIGGQAVLEGVMMRNRSRYAVAVRKPDGEIVVKKEKTRSARDRFFVLRLPIVRGVAAFLDSLILGIKTLSYSSDFLEEEEEKMSEDEEDGDNRRETVGNILIVLVSIFFAILFFMLLPFGLSELLRGKIQSDTALSVIEGVLRVVLFLGYVVAISFMSDIKRVFMYHGAEHKSINCVENGLDLTVENVRKQTRYHKRCGTSFLLIVMFVSIIFFLFIHIDRIWLRMLYRVLLIPVVAGVSFELITLAGNTDNKVVNFLSKPGMWLQRLTTREPDDGMIEVAIASIEAVFDWRKYQSRMLEQQDKKKSKRTAMVAMSLDGEHSHEDAGAEKEKTSGKEPLSMASETEQKKAGGSESMPAETKEAGKSSGKPDFVEVIKPSEMLGEELPAEKTRREKKKKASGGLKGAFARKGKKSRSQLRKELEQREEDYHNRAAERARQIKEQEEREAAHEKAYQAARKRTAERLAATGELPKVSDNLTPAPKIILNEDEEDLKGLDRFFDDGTK